MLQATIQGWAASRVGDAGSGTGRGPGALDRLARELGRRSGVTGEGGEATPGPDGAAESFAEAWAAHERDVARVCRRILGGREEARDAPQEVFLRARQAYSRYQPDRPFRAWVLAIAGNYCIDQLRHQAVQQRIFVDVDPEEASPAAHPGLSPLAGLLVREQRAQLGRAIAGLPLKYRLPLALRYFSELDYESIGTALGVSKGQVGTLLHRARLRLRAEMAAPPGPRPRRRQRKGRS